MFYILQFTRTEWYNDTDCSDCYFNIHISVKPLKNKDTKATWTMLQHLYEISHTRSNKNELVKKINDGKVWQ